MRCPECDYRFRPLPAADQEQVRCPGCGAWVDADEKEDRKGRIQRRPKRGSRGTKVLLGILGGCGLLVLVCAGGIGLLVWRLFAPTSFAEQTEDYAQARQHFQTRLLRQGPAPQEGESERPPPGVREVEYVSAGLRLRAWVNSPPQGGGRKPAVLFLHGGFAFGEDDWEQAQPFRDAGLVVMTPMVRGENGLPGSYSMFYNEVDDVLAAAEHLSRLSYVDGTRVYVAGHSAGGTLALLAALTSNRFRAGASFSGSPDQVAFSRGQMELVPFDPKDQREYQMRSPLAFARSFQCPFRLLYGSREFVFALSSKKTAELAKAAGKDVEAISVPGDHFTSVEPAMKQCITFFQQK